MTVRDPYTGVERKARPPRSFWQRWWPVPVIAALLMAASYAEWQHAGSPPPRAAVQANSATGSAAAPAPARTVPTGARPVAQMPATTAEATEDVAASLAALAKATDKLSADLNLLIGIAALQVIVLAGQLYLYGQQRLASRRPNE